MNRDEIDEVCPNCGSDQLRPWLQETQHGDASGCICEECELVMGDGQDHEPILRRTR